MSRIALAATRGIVVKCNQGKLSEFCGPIQLLRHWARSLLRQIKFVQRKATTAKSKHTVANLATLKRQFLADVLATVTMEEIPTELILNWNHTGIRFAPCSSCTMEQ